MKENQKQTKKNNNRKRIDDEEVRRKSSNRNEATYRIELIRNIFVVWAGVK